MDDEDTLVGPEELSFDVDRVVDTAIREWALYLSPDYAGISLPEWKEAIDTELEMRGYMQTVSGERRFDAEMDVSDLKEAVTVALTNWRADKIGPRKFTAEDLADYRRPCGE